MLLPGPATKEQRDQMFQAQSIQILGGISNQLDLLIQLESGYLPRKKMKEWFEAANKPTDPDQAVIAEAIAEKWSDGILGEEAQFQEEMAEMPTFEPLSDEAIAAYEKQLEAEKSAEGVDSRDLM